MSKYYDYRDILSHPGGTELQSHTDDVLNRIQYVNKQQSDKEFVKLLAEYHDIGKVTPFFQHYIRGCKYQKAFPQSNSTMKNHSLFGAITFLAVTKESQQYSFSDKQIINGFLSILKHHSTITSLKSLKERYIDSADRRQYAKQLKQQFKAIQEVPHIKEYFKNQLPNDVTLNDIKKYYTTEDVLTKIGNSISSSNIEEGQYQDILQYYGLLVFADKSSFEITRKELEYNTLSLKEISSYVSSELSPPRPMQDSYPSLQTELNSYREQARREALQTISQDNFSSGGLYTVKLPTGFGKTIVSLSAATYIHQQKPQSNIIYSLPLTSIIDQTDDTIQDIFDIEPTDPEYTVHHYLADTISEFDNSDSISKQQLHAESWSSELTLTTFVQLFDSLTQPSNSQSMKHANLYNNILIIDEIQSLSLEWWGIISEIFRVLIEKYNCHIISITATHPSFYTRPFIDLDPTPLISHEKYYNYLDENNRVEFQVHHSAESYFDPQKEETAITPEQLANEIHDTHDSTAIIQNTIKSAEEVYTTLQSKSHIEPINNLVMKHYSEFYTAYKDNTLTKTLNKYIQPDNVYALLLTSNFRPIDRKIYLDILQYLLDNDIPIIATATQIFQAGVDISFNTIYRDVAPASDIVQTAGRTNRSYGQETGRVIITATYDSDYDADTITSHAEHIYRVNRLNFLPHLTPSQNQPYTETQIINNGINEYYNKFFGKHDQTEEVYLGSKELVDAYKEGKPETIRDHQLISTEDQIDILIPPTQDVADSIDKQLQQNIPIEEIKYTHQEYIVSIRNNADKMEEISSLINIGKTNLDTNSEDDKLQDLHTCIYTDPNTYYKPTGLINPTEQTQFI